jgi:hypothetical protein
MTEQELQEIERLLELDYHAENNVYANKIVEVVPDLLTEIRRLQELVSRNPQ